MGERVMKEQAQEARTRYEGKGVGGGHSRKYRIGE
jgi:hypothetical protein